MKKNDFRKGIFIIMAASCLVINGCSSSYPAADKSESSASEDEELKEPLPTKNWSNGEFIHQVTPSEDYGNIYPFILPKTMYGFCDQNGQIICDGGYSEVVYIEGNGTENGFYVALQYHAADEYGHDYTYSVISVEGDYMAEYEEIVIESKHREVDSIYIPWHLPEGLEQITVKANGKWGTVDGNGRPAILPEYDNPLIFSEGLAAVRLSEDTYGYLDTEGNLVIGPLSYNFNPEAYQSYQYIFVAGVAPFYQDEKWGYIDKEGNVVIPPVYDKAKPFNRDGYSLVDKEENQYYIDVSGNQILPADEELIISQHTGGDWFYCSKKGKGGEIYLWHRDETTVRADGFVTDSGWVLLREENVRFLKGEETFTIDGYKFKCHLANGNISLTNDSGWMLVNADGETLATGPEQISSNSMAFIVRSDNQYQVYDDNGCLIEDEEIAEYIVKSAYPKIVKGYNGYLAFYGEDYGGIRTPDGEWLFQCIFDEEGL